MVADAVALSLGFAAALIVGVGSTSDALEVETFALTLLSATLLSGAYGLYSRDEERVNHSTADDVIPIVHVMLVVTWMVALVIWVGAHNVELGGPFAFLVTSILLVLVGRALTRTWYRRHADVQNTVIVGAGAVGQRLAAKLVKRSVHGLRVVGFVDDEPPELASELAGIPVLGGVESLQSLIQTWGVERVIVAFSVHSHERTERLLSSLKGVNVQVDIVPRLFDMLGPSAEIHTIDGMALIGNPGPNRSRAAERAKRAIDLVLAGIGLLLGAPVLALIALVVKLDSPGPAVYRAERIGRGGRSFSQLKFRTMHAQLCDGPQYGGNEAESAFVALLAGNQELREQYERTQKLDPDPRVTAVGRMLRATSLDELPQLWNVIRGELSLVGPRPVTAQELSRYGEQAGDLLSVRPGLTGYWQISGRSALGYDERVRLDLAYVKSWSLKLDLLILLRTTNLLTGRAGAV